MVITSIKGECKHKLVEYEVWTNQSFISALHISAHAFIWQHLSGIFRLWMFVIHGYANIVIIGLLKISAVYINMILMLLHDFVFALSW